MHIAGRTFNNIHFQNNEIKWRQKKMAAQHTCPYLFHPQLKTFPLSRINNKTKELMKIYKE
jgi:hypothetical protein